MADLEIIHERAEGYNQQGHSVSYTDSYIKIRKSFRLKALRTLKGPALSVFMEIALSDEPPTVQTICADTGYSPHTVCNALDFLTSHFFIEEQGRDGSRGAKCYRALSYTWTGSDRNAPPEPTDTPSVSSGPRIAKNAIRPKYNTTSERPVELQPGTIRRTQSTIRPVVVDGTESNPSLEEKEEQQQPKTAAQLILRSAGILGKPLEELREIQEAVAASWAQWIRSHPKGVRSPRGLAVNALRDDINSLPPESDTPPEPKRTPHFQGLFAEMENDDLDDSPEA